MEGGELFNRIQERADSAFTERGVEVILSFDALLCLINIFSLPKNKYMQFKWVVKQDPVV